MTDSVLRDKIENNLAGFLHNPNRSPGKQLELKSSFVSIKSMRVHKHFSYISDLRAVGDREAEKMKLGESIKRELGIG